MSAKTAKRAKFYAAQRKARKSPALMSRLQALSAASSRLAQLFEERIYNSLVFYSRKLLT